MFWSLQFLACNLSFLSQTKFTEQLKNNAHFWSIFTTPHLFLHAFIFTYWVNIAGLFCLVSCIQYSHTLSLIINSIILFHVLMWNILSCLQDLFLYLLNKLPRKSLLQFYIIYLISLEENLLYILFLIKENNWPAHLFQMHLHETSTYG